MRKILIVGYAVVILWIPFMLAVSSQNLENDIQGQGSSFIFGYLTGVFLFTFIPISLVGALHYYLSMKQKQKERISNSI